MKSTIGIESSLKGAKKCLKMAENDNIILINTVKTSLSIQSIIRYTHIKRDFMMKYKLMSSGFDTLIYIIEHWQKSSKGVSIMSIHKSWGVSGKAVHNVHKRVLILERKELIEVLGIGKYATKEYCPTIKVIRELNELLM